MNTFQNICCFFELLPVIVSIFCWKAIKHSYYKWFSAFLLYVFLADCFSPQLAHYIKIANQHYYDYLILPVEYLFNLWLYYKYFRDTKYKKVPVYFSILYIISFIMENSTSVISSYWSFNSFSSDMGVLFLLIMIAIFYFDQVRGDISSANKDKMMIWISGGILLSYGGTLPYYSLLYLISSLKNETLMYLLYYYSMILMIVSSIFYSIGFLWLMKKA